MHNYRVATERKTDQKTERYFVFASELHTLLRSGVERWVSIRQATIPGGVPMILPGQAAQLSDVAHWSESRPASWEPAGTFYPMALMERFNTFLFEETRYTTLFQDRGDAGQYWLPSYIATREQAWLDRMKLATGPLVPPRDRDDTCGVPDCDEVISVVKASSTYTRDGDDLRAAEFHAYGVGLGRSALSRSCGEFDLGGFEELAGALGKEAAAATVLGRAASAMARPVVATGDET
jgi:hypothetical protein